MSPVLALGATASLLLLGAIQGATEFLPVSSSGHLVIFGEWLGLGREEGLSREIALHLGTLVAVVFFCFSDLLAMLRKGSAGLWRLVLGSAAVTAVLGLALEDPIETWCSTLLGAGLGLLGTTVLLVVVAPNDDERQTKAVEDGTWRDAALMGLFQTLALMPGISRAGATIVGALVLGYRRPHAVRIAFLMSIPVVGGAILLDTLESDGPPAILQGAMPAALVVACLVGLVALRIISVRVDARSLRFFGLYTGLLGTVAILSS